jgi:DNA-binding LacI/PurR family transcriptional regulator
MRIRLQDVAAQAEVSESTVSRVMNAKSGVSERTRTRVIAVLAEMGYAPPALHAPQLGAVGVIVPELDNPIFPKFVQTIETRLLASGYICVLGCATRVGAGEDDYLDLLVDRRVSGVVVVSGRHADVRADHSIYQRVIELGIALVTVNGGIPDSDIASVSADDRGATSTAYRHLRSLGHERIGLLIGPRCYTPVLRKLEGFLDEAHRDGVVGDHEELVAETIFGLDGGYSGAQRLYDAGVTGIVAASDMMALGAIRAARQRGLSVPDDVSIVGFDDTELMRFTDPPLTTVHQPVTRIVDYAVDVLLAQIQGQPFDRTERILPGELIVRATTTRSRAGRIAPIG